MQYANRLLICALISFLLLSRQPSGAQVQVYEITYLGSEVLPYAINSRGHIAGQAPDGNYWRAFFMRDGVLTKIGLVSAFPQSTAQGINDSDQVVGYEFPDSSGGGDPDDSREGFIWQNGITTMLASLGGNISAAYGINNVSQIVGQSNPAGDFPRLVMWQSGILHDLGTPLGTIWASGQAINNAGQIAGFATSAFLWQNGVFTDLGNLPGLTYSFGTSINNSGRLAGYAAFGFTWLGGILTDLGTLPGFDSSTALSINDAGAVVGYAYRSSPDYASHAYVRQFGKMQDLNELLPPGSGWILEEARAINSRGQIVGNGYFNGLYLQGFLLTPLCTLLPNRGGNAGTTSIQVVRPGLTAGAGTTATLKMAVQTDIPGLQPRVFEDDNFKTSVLHVSFDLTNAKPGKWTLEINTPNVPTITLKNVFTVEEARNPVIGVQVTGRTLARGGFPTIYQVVVSNSGNFDAVNVPVWIATTDTGADIIPEFPVLTPPAISNLSVNWGIYPQAVKTATQKMLAVIVPRVPPGGTVALSFRVKFSSLADFQVGAWTSPLYKQLLPGLSTNPVKESLREIGRQVYALTTGDPLLDSTDSDLGNAASKTVDQLGAVRDNAYKNNLILDSMSSLTWMLEQEVLLMAQYKSRSITDTALKSAIATVFSQLGTYAPKSFTAESLLQEAVKVSDSDDPNHGCGPVSEVPDLSPGNWVGGDSALGFSVQFENKPTASFPTQAVTVIDQLDPVALDLSTLSLGPISVPGGKARPVSGISPVSTSGDGSPSSGDYTADISLPASSTRPHALYLHIRAYLDAATSRLIWRFTSSRQDGQPMTAEDGFLAAGEEGSVTFQVYSNRTSPTYQTENYARIYFDQDQTGIETNHWANTIDAAKPDSAVAALAAKRTNPNIALNWTGSDMGVSTTPRDYTLFVRDWADGVAFLPYVEHTTSKSTAFTGVGGHTYSFLTVATDWTGNTELITGADATTTVALGPYLLPLTPNPVPGSQSLNGMVSINAPAPAGGAVISLTNKNTAAKFSNGVDTMTLTIPAGEMTSSPFSMTTTAVASNVAGAVSAKWAGVTKSTNLTVRPIGPASLTFGPTSVRSKGTTTGTVMLEAPAAPGDVAVALSSGNTALLTVPASVTVVQGSTSATFTAQAKTATVSTPVKVNATAAGITKTGTVKVLANGVTSFVLTPTSVVGGTSATATITLDAVATANTTVTLYSSAPSVAWFVDGGGNTITTTTILSGSKSKGVKVKTAAVTATKNVTLKATANGLGKSQVLTVTP